MMMMRKKKKYANLMNFSTYEQMQDMFSKWRNVFVTIQE